LFQKEESAQTITEPAPIIRKSSRQLHGLVVGQSVPQIHCKLKLETIFRSENVAHLQEATLRSADVIIACAEAGVRSLRYRPSRRPRAFLKEFPASNAGGVAGPSPTPQIAKFRLEAIQTGKGKSYMRNPIVQQFLEGSEQQGSELEAAGRAHRWQKAARRLGRP
jgi:hypothetical protein